MANITVADYCVTSVHPLLKNRNTLSSLWLLLILQDSLPSKMVVRHSEATSLHHLYYCPPWNSNAPPPLYMDRLFTSQLNRTTYKGKANQKGKYCIYLSTTGCQIGEHCLCACNTSINQSINQSNFYIANIPSEARLSGTTTESVFNSKIEETVP